MGFGAEKGFCFFCFDFLLSSTLAFFSTMFQSTVWLPWSRVQSRNAPVRGHSRSKCCPEGNFSQISSHLLNSSSSHDHIPLTSEVVCNPTGAPRFTHHQWRTQGLGCSCGLAFLHELRCRVWALRQQGETDHAELQESPPGYLCSS